MAHFKRVVELNDNNSLHGTGQQKCIEFVRSHSVLSNLSRLNEHFRQLAEPNHSDMEKAKQAYQRVEVAWTERGTPSAALYHRIGVLLFSLHN